MSSAETNSLSESYDGFFAKWIASWARKVKAANNKNIAAATSSVQARNLSSNPIDDETVREDRLAK